MSAFDTALARLLTPGTRVAALDTRALDWLETHAPQVVRQAPDSHERADLALGFDTLEGCDARTASERLFHARTWVAPVVIMRVGTGCPLDADAWRALAFEPLAQDGDETLYQFNLSTYKPVPDWLNARFWANPERWEP